MAFWLYQKSKRKESSGDEKVNSATNPFVNTDPFRPPSAISNPGNPFLDSYHANFSPSCNPFETQPHPTRESCLATFPLTKSSCVDQQDRFSSSPFPTTFQHSGVQSDSSCIHRKERVPETFSGSTTELKDWIVQFEIIARYSGWTEAEKGSNLASSLRGNAQ